MTKVYGHRGMMGGYPENTLLSFEKALEAGADGLEIDVHLTKDGEFIVMHDATLNRTTNGIGPVSEYTFSEIRELQLSCSYYSSFAHYDKSWEEEKIPSLTEVLQLVSSYPEAALNIELKTDEHLYEDIEQRLIDHVNRFPDMKDRVIYSSFHLPTLIRLRHYDRDARLAWIINQPISHPEDYIDILGLEALHIGMDTFLKHIYHWGKWKRLLRVWTVNDKDTIKQLLDIKVKAIITDYPDRAIFYRCERYAMA
ncbi:glycerophosphodiester phosphodiesterase [Oceanobacillus neutriphilus]|uniref:Glycerophosphoryl diester phosphodiesterase n=1 Tax=Oceanobacillus neutriphilus TaxID=531815 RepID=A0ABQ2NWD8_9BACI|nr:glycerophosphodiester phosphodiesterase family protein [Oceanobacillus neutriphilus]GGP12234.1 glycerophosphoryl diester phosphodiesterase [Oceanobacillus neutriphilus]